MPIRFETADAASILETDEQRINKLLDRFGLGASIKGGGAQGRPWRFEVQDVCRVGLALWLFQAGLRAEVIRDTLKLKEIRSLLSRLSNLKGIRAKAKRTGFLVTRGIKQPVVLSNDWERVRIFLKQNACVVIPLGRLLERLATRLESFAV